MKNINTYNTTLHFDKYANMLLAEKSFRLIGIELDFLRNSAHNEEKKYRSAYMITDGVELTIEVKQLTQEDVQSFSDFHDVLDIIEMFDANLSDEDK
ncbi:MAG: hypothetical protein ABGY11_01525 [Candidatus Thioglobus sp.]